jgi:CsoR family transcriptional regulator, copper-sensing transcriptional repressor
VVVAELADPDFVVDDDGVLLHALERTNRVMLHNHLETCFSEAVLGGKGENAIAELVDALKFSPALTGPDTCLNGTPADEAMRAGAS